MSDQEATEGIEPDRLSLTIAQLEHLYDILDYKRPETAVVSTAHLLIKTLTDDEIAHGIARCMLECHKAIAKDIIDRAKSDEPIADTSMLDGLPRLNAALAKAQAEFPLIPKTRTATKRWKDKEGAWQSFEYHYADLADILNSVCPILGRFGLAVTQPFRRRSNGRLYLVTLLRHASGEVLSSDGLIMPDEESVSPQEFGSQHSYWRRYDLSGTIGVAAVEDDDGQFSQRSNRGTSTGERTAATKGKQTKVEADKKSLETGDVNAGHGQKDSPKPAVEPRKPAPTTPAPTPIITDEKVAIMVGVDDKKKEQLMDWKKLVGRVRNVTGTIEAKNKQKSKYIQVIVEGLGASNRKEEGKEYKPAQLFHCFRATLFNALALMPGEVCEFYFDPAEAKGTYYQNIEEVLKIGDRKFSNGKPVEEPETKAETPSQVLPEAAQSPPTGLFPAQGPTEK